MDMSKTQPTHLIVVDDYEPCPCHTIVLTRGIDTIHSYRAWVILNVINPCQVGFGDRIDYDYNKNEAYLVRNEKLKFKLQLDKILVKHRILLSESLPYAEMYNEISILFPDIS